MARVIEEPEVVHEHYHDGGNSASGAGFILGILLLVVLAVLFFYYGLPAIRSTSSPTVNVPGTIDVNVNK